MRAATTFLIASLALGAAASPAAAFEDAEMAALAKRNAVEAPNRLGRPGLGPPAIADYATAQFRGVRANYARQILVNDQIVFCGEVNLKGADKEYIGWTKFAYIPGDPPIFVTPRPGIGLREVGPQVFRNNCESGKEQWLDADFTTDLQRPPGPPA